MGLCRALKDLMSNPPLFQVTNHHGEACGIPPQIGEQAFPGVYRSYFENQNGEPGKGFNALNTWKAEWVRANASLIKEVEAEKWLSRLLEVLKAL
jgi:hypothetical protein